MTALPFVAAQLGGADRAAPAERRPLPILRDDLDFEAAEAARRGRQGRRLRGGPELCAVRDAALPLAGGNRPPHPPNSAKRRRCRDAEQACARSGQDPSSTKVQRGHAGRGKDAATAIGPARHDAWQAWSLKRRAGRLGRFAEKVDWQRRAAAVTPLIG